MPIYKIVLSTGSTQNVELSGNTDNNIFLYAPQTTTTTTTTMAPPMASFGLFVEDGSIGDPPTYSMTVYNGVSIEQVPEIGLFVEDGTIEDSPESSLTVNNGVIEDLPTEDTYSLTVNNGQIENAETYSLTVENGLIDSEIPVTTTTTTTIAATTTTTTVAATTTTTTVAATTTTTTVAPSGGTVKYGYLYNWYAATDIRKISSSNDWILPNYILFNSNGAFEILCEYLGSSSPTNNTLGYQLKESGTEYWLLNTSGNTNSSNFNLRGAGSRINGLFNISNYSLLEYTGLWTTRDAGGDKATVAETFDSGNTFTYPNSNFSHSTTKNDGLSIRLVRTSTTLSHGQTGTYTGNNGRIYNTICIGTQEWLSENLAETKYRNGDTITVIEDNNNWSGATSGALCSYDNNYANVDSGGVPPILMTTSLIETTVSQIRINTEVNYASSETCLEKGAVLSVSGDPSLSNYDKKHISTCGSSSGNNVAQFTITDCSGSTTYNVRGYMTTNSGTYYSNMIVATTLDP